MSRVAILAAAFVLTALRGAAQASTADTLAQAQRLYEQLEIERALPLLRRVISPSWSFEVTPAQRVETYTYLGASLALLGQTDSAVTAFRRAIEQDAFAQLDPQRFTPAQRALFADAQRLSFAVGARAVRPARLDPRTERLTFAVVTSHSALVRVELRPPAPLEAVELFASVSEGAREIPWDGLVGAARLAPPGRYELAVTALSRLIQRGDTARVYFDLRHELAERLEDTLPELGPGDLLPERRSGSTAGLDLLKGLAVAGGALLAGAVASDDLGGTESSLAVAAAGAATLTGIVAFVHGRRHREIPSNVAANAARRTQRDTSNEAIRRRNAERVARTVLLVEPAAGADR